MTDFRDRINQSQTLEKPFIEIFNEKCATHRIVKFGFESTAMSEYHNDIVLTKDDTSQFLRYLPDSVLTSRSDNRSIEPKTGLIEFKVQNILLDKKFLSDVQRDYHKNGNEDLPLTHEDQVFNIEKDAFDTYLRVASLEIAIVVVAWQNPTQLLRAQYVDKIKICNEHTPRPGGRGSGTTITNTHIDSYQEAETFFNNEFGISTEVLSAIKNKLAT